MKRRIGILLVLVLCVMLCACSREGQVIGTCTVSISCRTLLGHEGEMTPEKAELVPEDGWILEPISVELREGDTAFDLLQRITRAEKIHMEFSETPLYRSAYVEGIGNLYEFDCGAGSGWMFLVNEAFPNVSASETQLSDGDRVQWCYTRNRGGDLGQIWEEQP